MKLAVTQMILGFLVLICGVALLTFAIQEITKDNSQVDSYTLQFTTGNEQKNVTITFPTETLSGKIVAVTQEKVYPLSSGISLAIGCILPLSGIAIIISGVFQTRNARKPRITTSN